MHLAENQVEIHNYMRKTLIFLFVVACQILLSCKSSSDNLKPEEVVVGYINGLNESSFKQIEPYISDSLLTMEGDFVLTQSSEEYKIHFQWDSVFSPEYNIINSKKISDNSIEVILSKTCDRIKYLHDTATVYTAIFDLDNNHIIKINNTALIYFDTLKWSNRRDTLVAWVKKHHPELDGFIYDQTLVGAQNYLKAIELYHDKK